MAIAADAFAKGRLLLVQLEEPAGSGTFVDIAGCTSNGCNITNGLQDNTATGRLPWRSFDTEFGHVDYDIQLTGHVKLNEDLLSLMTFAKDRTARVYRISSELGWTITGSFLVDGVPHTGELESPEAYSYTLTSTIDSAASVPEVYYVGPDGVPSNPGQYLSDLGWLQSSSTGWWYKLTSERHFWTDAEAEAVSVGGHLAYIPTSTENEWLADTFNGTTIDDVPAAYMGYNDISVEGTWEWVSGDTGTFTAWNTGEPSGGTAQNWGSLNLRDAGTAVRATWSDVGTGNATRQGIMQIQNPSALTAENWQTLRGGA